MTGEALAALDEADLSLVPMSNHEQKVLLSAIYEYKRKEYEDARRKLVVKNVEEWMRENEEEA